MKLLFSIIAMALSLAGFITYLNYPANQTRVPVIYWVTDKNPARVQQMAKFEEWLVRNGHFILTKDGRKRAAAEIRIDTANRDASKQIIQGVSGVGGDIIDCQDVDVYHSIGLFEDITEDAIKMGFSTNATYHSVIPKLTSTDEKGRVRQYSYPCNVSARMYWVNRATFRKYGITPPPRRWTFEDFERIGLELRDKATPPGERPTVFLAPDMVAEDMYRTLGLSSFNETLTECTLNDERYVRVLKLLDKWRNEDHILPTKADMLSFDSESGYGGPRAYLFNTGNYGLFMSGRWGLIGLRRFGSLELSVSEPPHGGFPIIKAGARSAGIYKGGKNKKVAKLFLAYLASETYNKIIVGDADALPPNPVYADDPEFKQPPEHPNEWGCHEVFSESLKNIGIPEVTSPYIGRSEFLRIFRRNKERFEAHLCSAEEAARATGEEVNLEIQRTLREFPLLRDRHKKAVEVQKNIDRARSAGRLVPRDWVSNPYHLAHGRRLGWISEHEANQK